MSKVTIFTYADATYFRFVAPFIYFWFRTNPDVSVEVIVSDRDSYMRWYSPQVEFLKCKFPSRQFLIRNQVVSKDIVPNTVRFVEMPEIVSEYVYIADIDILVLDSNVTEQHVGEMERTKLPYSNIKRVGSEKLSGLHFSRSDAYYPLPDLDGIDLTKQNDEAVLYEIVSRKGLAIPISDFRPVHGIHVSYNRPVVMEDSTLPGWGITKEYLERFRLLVEEPSFVQFESLLDKGMQNTLDRIRSVARVTTNGASPTTVAFNVIYQQNEWGSPNSRSGPGSTWSATKRLRHQLRRVLTELNIRTMLDAPCGDANWISEVVQHLDFYIGVDIVPELIASNAMYHAERNMAFKVADLTKDRLPKVDAIFSRDCLVHLPLDMAVEGLRRFVFSGSKYLISTTFTATTENVDTPRPGPWRQLNLELAPFSFPPPIRVINERLPGEPFADKSLGVWQIEDLRRLFDN